GINGHFTIQVGPSTDSLKFTYVGYSSLNKTLSADMGIILLSQSFTQLNQIVVSGSRDERERTEIPAALSLVSAQTLAETKPATIDQALNKVAGVYMADLGNEQHMMSVRQPISTKSLYLYLEDGIPIRTMGIFNHNALIEMNMAALKQIEIIRGPYSSIYGSEAIGGAFNFITLKPSAVPVAKLSLRANSIGYKRAEMLVSNTFGKTGFLLSGYYGWQHDGFREHSDFNKLALTGKYVHPFNDKLSLTGSLTYINYVTDMTGSLDSVNYYGQKFSSLHTFTKRDVHVVRFLNTLEQRWNDHSRTTVTLIARDNLMGQVPSYRVKDDYSRWSNPTGDKNLAHGEINSNYFKSLGTVVQHRQFFPWLSSSLVTGLSGDYSPLQYDANYIRIDKNDEGVYINYVETDSVLTDYRVALSNFAGYIQGELAPVKNLRISGALRSDLFIYDYTNNLSEMAFSGAPDSRDHFTALTPKLGLTWDMGKSSGLYANWSKGFAPPQVSELYQGVKIPTLGPGIFSNVEMGTWISMWKGKAVLDLAVYSLWGKNEIISVKMDDGSTENRNAGETLHQGIEYNFLCMPAREFTFRFSGTNARHLFMNYVEKGVDYSQNRMSGAPPFIYNTEGIFKTSRVPGFRVGIEWQHVDKYFLDNSNSEKYEGHNLFNMRISQQVAGFEYWLHVMNFTNTLYATMASKSNWGKSYNMGNPRSFELGL
ncbi:MAG: TonB-dependent receptor, partial [Cyclobacteriaceae bacterium]|nr:TonB-dependent receptor [Cyclobacteriaceae bacterium]